jgi:hypothetical protein
VTHYGFAPMNLPRLTLIALLLACVFAPAARASSDQASIMMDDDQLLYRSNVTQTKTLVTMQSMGADSVRATMLWKVVAQGADLSMKDIKKLKTAKQRAAALAQRKRFKADDPRTYPTRNWDRYDNLVKEAARLGMRVYFTITGPGPAYGMGVAPKSQRANAGTYKPKAAQYLKFVEAVGKRYSGKYRDENATRKALPRVSLWSLWNEPNQAGWLSPQSEKIDGKMVPVAPALYRELYQAGVKGLQASGHGSDAIFLGETAPLGSDAQGPRDAIRPGAFLREMLCIAPNGTPYTGADATARRCDDFTKDPTLVATAYAHHPYTKKAAPTIAPKNPDEITIANIGTLGTTLDTLAAESGGKIAAGLPIFLTEFGYESNPPDPRNGIPLMRQAQFNELADFLAYQDPRVQATTQFLLRDAAPLKRSPVTGKAYKVGSRDYWFTYQSGLLTAGGHAKPAAFAYTLPFVVFPDGAGQVGFWGQLRFRPNLAQDTALIMWCPDDKSVKTCVQVGDGVPTAFRGFFSGSVAAPQPGGFYRAGYFVPATDTTPAKIGAYSLPAAAP